MIKIKSYRWQNRRTALLYDLKLRHGAFLHWPQQIQLCVSLVQPLHQVLGGLRSVTRKLPPHLQAVKHHQGPKYLTGSTIHNVSPKQSYWGLGSIQLADITGNRALSWELNERWKFALSLIQFSSSVVTRRIPESSFGASVHGKVDEMRHPNGPPETWTPQFWSHFSSPAISLNCVFSS